MRTEVFREETVKGGGTTMGLIAIELAALSRVNCLKEKKDR